MDAGESKMGPDTEMNPIGKRFKLKYPHPHCDEYGIAVQAEMTHLGPGLVIRLENCKHGIAECMAFDPYDLEPAEPETE